MNPPSELRFPRISFAKAEAGASPGAAAFLEDLIDACVMECYFREHRAERDLLFHDTVAPHLAAYAPEASADQKRAYLTRPTCRMRRSKRSFSRLSCSAPSGCEGPKRCSLETGRALRAKAIHSEIGEHQIRYYGWYSNKKRGQRAKGQPSVVVAEPQDGGEKPLTHGSKQARKRGAALIKQVYEVDPLSCPKCGAEMKTCPP